ncbi:MAG TPA: hypothetical protein VGC16_10630, partial [Rhizomicrobium sp.]
DIAAAERTLFDAAPAQQSVPAQRHMIDDVVDDMPPPAYPPRQPARDLHVEDNPGDFVAPRPRQPGQPSAEAMARLQAAVNKQPGSYAPQGYQQRPAAQQPRPAPQPAHEKPRFGINSLINRMTGHAAEGAAQPVRQQPAAQQPVYDDEPDQDQDRIEIPAFLRRQAN